MDEFAYMEEQRKSWKGLGLDVFMSRPLANSFDRFVVPDEYDFMIETGALSGNKIKNITAEQIVASTLISPVDVGSGTSGAYVRIDGPNNRIEIHDGTVPRIIIGNV